MLNCIRFGRKRSWPFRGIFPTLSWRTWEIPREDVAPPARKPRTLLLGVLQMYNGHTTTAVCRACAAVRMHLTVEIHSPQGKEPSSLLGTCLCYSILFLLSDASRSPCRVTLIVLVGSAWPYPYLRLMSIPQLLVYLVANCGLAAWAYSLGEYINTAVWGKISALRYTKYLPPPPSRFSCFPMYCTSRRLALIDCL